MPLFKYLIKIQYITVEQSYDPPRTEDTLTNCASASSLYAEVKTRDEEKEMLATGKRRISDLSLHCCFIFFLAVAECLLS